MIALTLMAAAWAFEAAIGWPDWLYRRVRHPVVWIGALSNVLDTRLNQTAYAHATRYALGALSASIVIAITVGAAWLISRALPGTWWGFAIEAVIASSLIASRNLYQHVSALLTPLKRGDVGAARALSARLSAVTRPSSMSKGSSGRASKASPKMHPTALSRRSFGAACWDCPGLLPTRP